VRKSLEKLNTAIQLSESGSHSAAVDFLSQCSDEEIEASPTLGLLLGSSLARLGRHSEGLPLVDRALEQARERGDHAVELHALNARGAIALVTGKIDEAEDYFTRGLAAAKRAGDLAAVGRCSNNLGIIEYYRGKYGRALSSYNIALAAFQQVGSQRGVAEVEHNWSGPWSRRAARSVQPPTRTIGR
jgi:tetratricopeptide (TPR) repeat protein